MESQDNIDTCTINNITFNLTTSHTDRNVIKVSSKREIFFDVFECAIYDGQTLVLEKVDEIDMLPVVNVEFTRDDKIYTCEAVLIEDRYEEFIINEDNIFFSRYISTSTSAEVTNDEIDCIEDTDIDHLPESSFTNDEIDCIEDTDIDHLPESSFTNDEIDCIEDTDIDHLPESSYVSYEDQKDSFIQLLDEQLNHKLFSLKEDFSAQLETFIEKIAGNGNQLIEDKLSEIDTVVESKFQNLKEDIKVIEDFSKQNITEAIKKKIYEIESFFNTYLENLGSAHEQRENKNLSKINNNLLKINTVKESIQKSNSSIDNLQTKIKVLEELESKIVTLDHIKERFVDESRLTKESKNIIKLVTEKILELSDNIQANSKEQKKKYDSFVSSIRVEDVQEVKTIIYDKIDEAQIDQLRESLQSNIEKSLKGDIISLKRYVEMSSGGGSVAVQYANGGVMNGDLTVAGTLSAQTYLGIEVPSVQGLYLPLSGGSLTGQLSSNSTIIADTIVATNLLSSTRIDIGYELSGFDVTGNVSVSGNIDISKNITLSGDLYLDGFVNDRDIAVDGIIIDNLETDVIYLSSIIDDNDLDIAYIQTDVAYLSSEIDITNTDVAYLSSEIDITNTDVAYLSSQIGGGGAWGDITGTLSAQTDLQNALDLKASLLSPTFTGTATFEKITLTQNSFVTETADFTLSSTHNGATVLLQNTTPITITVPSQVSGYTVTFISETINSVTFASGVGLSGFNSFNGANRIAGIYGQAQIIFKSSDYAFLGGNVV